MTKFFRFFADLFFRKKYDKRALILETIAGVPGMVAGMLVHLRSLRRLQKGNGTMIHEMLAEAENERKHLMFFMEVVHPNTFERALIIFIQFVFWHFYLLMYFLSPKTSHLMVHYFEKEAVRSYTEYLEMIRAGEMQDPHAPEIAIEYYNLPKNARISDMILMIREDEQKHADLNIRYANEPS